MSHSPPHLAGPQLLRAVKQSPASAQRRGRTRSAKTSSRAEVSAKEGERERAVRICAAAPLVPTFPAYRIRPAAALLERGSSMRWCLSANRRLSPRLHVVLLIQLGADPNELALLLLPARSGCFGASAAAAR